MKVGIMSMQRICNYGSFLQAYGLKKTIKSLGHTVEFVDFKPGKPIFGSEYGKKDYIKARIREKVINLAAVFEPMLFFAPMPLRYALRSIRNYNGKYIKLLGMSKKHKYNTPVDTLVIGSDEVFNCFQYNIKIGYSRELFGYNNRADKVITYAASFGNTTINEIERFGKREEISGMLGKMSAISARDENTAQLTRELTGKDAKMHLDPVLIYDFSEEIPDCANIPDKYMVVYAYRNRINRDEAQKICDYAKEKGLKIVSIGGYQSFCDIYVQGTPFEILDYFKKAECVVTDTFHGTIFSVINHKNFATFVREGHGKKYGNREKLMDLLVRLGLSDRILKGSSGLHILDMPIDYTETDAIITKAKEETITYLKENL